MIELISGIMMLWLLFSVMVGLIWLGEGTFLEGFLFAQLLIVIIGSIIVIGYNSLSLIAIGLESL